MSSSLRNLVRISVGTAILVIAQMSAFGQAASPTAVAPDLPPFSVPIIM